MTKNELITITQASAISGVARKTIYAWIKQGQLTEVTENGKKFIRRSDLLAKISGAQPTTAATAMPKRNIIETVRSEPVDGDQQEEVHRRLSRNEAERIIKVEDAIKKHRENLLLEGKLLVVEEFVPALQDFLAECFDGQRELIDKMTIEWRLSSSQQARAQKDFNDILRRSFERIEQKINAGKNAK